MSIFDIFRKEQYTDYVDISIGRVYIKPLTNGIINRVTSKATIYGSVLNNSIYFSLMEYNLLKLNKKQIDKLSLKDGNSIREKIKEILARHNLITIEEVETKNKDGFTDSELEIFKQQEKEMIDRFKGK